MSATGLSPLQRVACLVMVLALAGCSYYWLYLEQSHQRLRTGTTERFEHQSAQLAGAVSRQLILLTRLIDFSVVHLRDTLGAGDERLFQATAMGVIDVFPSSELLQIGVIDRYGYLLYSTSGISGRVYLGDREYFQAYANSEEDRLFIGHPLIDRVSKKWVIPFTRPIYRSDGFGGVVFLAVSPQYLASTLLLPEAGIDDVTSVIYPDGHFASRSNNLEEALERVLSADQPFVGETAALSGTAHLNSAVDNIPRIYSWRRLEEFPLTVVVGLAKAQILDPVERSIREDRRRALIAVLIILGLASGIVTLLLRVDRDERSLQENERFLDGIVENIPAMLFVKDAAELRYVRFNKAGEELLGCSRQELIGRSDHEVFSREQADGLTAKDRQVLAGLEVVDIPEERIQTRFGSKVLHTRKIGISDRSGTLKFLMGVSVDITGQKWLQDLDRMRRLILETLTLGQSLEEILDYVARLIEQHHPEVQCLILLLDPSGELCHAAAAGLPEPFRPSCQPPDSADPAQDFFRTLARSGQRMQVAEIATDPAWAAVADLARQAGLCSYWSEPIRGTDGQILGAFALCLRTRASPEARDIQLMVFAAETSALVIERKRTEAELESWRLNLEELVANRTRELLLARDLAETANRARSDFLANMSHELRTPLNAVMGFSELLRREVGLTPAQYENLDIIHRNGACLLGLVNDILDIVKIDSGRVQVRQAPFSLIALIVGVVDGLRTQAMIRGVQLRVEQADSAPRFIRSDEARLRQILVSLVDNAIKFTDAGTVTLRVALLPGQAPPWLCIEVQDSGIGISPDDQQRIFDPFVRADRANIRKGTGLGLSITRQFVELLGGRMSVTSQIGQGSCFRVELPVELAEEADVQLVGDEEREVVGLAPGQPDYRILVIADQPEEALLLRRVLEAAGFGVQVARPGVQSVARFQSGPPDFVWIDWRRSQPDDFETVRRLRASQGGAAVKIVALTTVLLPEQQAEILAAGVDDTLVQAYPFSNIFNCMAYHLGVRYRYEKSPVAGDSTEWKVLAPAVLAKLPAQLRRELAEAVVALDADRIAALIVQVAEDHAALASILRQHADNFEYGLIDEALKEM